MGVQNINLGARKQRRDHFEGRVFGSGANENNVARFNVREKGVLLGFVEAVHFVHENDGAAAGLGLEFRGGHDFLDFFDSRKDRAEGNEF